MTVSPQFIGSVAANIAYWQQRTRDPEEEQWSILARERPNLIRAAQYGQAIAGTWRETATMLLQCYELIERQAAGSPWIPLFESLVNRCPDTEVALKCELMNRLGNCYRHERALEKALDIHQVEYLMAMDLGNQLRLGHAQGSLSLIYCLQRKYGEAERFGVEALGAFQRLQAEPHKLGAVTNVLGLVAHGRGDLDLAEERFRHAAGLFRQAGHTVNLARTLTNLARTLEVARKTTEAFANYQEALGLLNKTEYELEKSAILIALGLLYYNQGQLQKAEESWLSANSTFLRRSGRAYLQAMVISNLAHIYIAQGDIDKAEKWFRKSIDLWRGADAHLMLANTLGDLAALRVTRGDSESASALYDEATRICQEYPDDDWGRRMALKFESALARLKDN